MATPLSGLGDGPLGPQNTLTSVDERLRRRRLALLLAPISCLVIASMVGSALAPTLVVDHPVWLLVLDARIRHVLLVANQIDAFPYFLIGTLRLTLSDPLFYLLGYWYGEAALSWVEAQSGSVGRLLRVVERFFGKASYPLVFLAPNNYICLFSGASRMPPPVFLALNISGTITRLILLRALGDVLEDPLEAVLDFIARNQLRLTLLTVGLVVAQAAWDKRRGTGELGALSELEERIEEEEEEEAAEAAEAGEGDSTQR
jgi:membrane protein DedA with SNARE-associated domain